MNEATERVAAKMDYISNSSGHVMVPAVFRRSSTYRVLMFAAWAVLFIALYVGATE